MDGGNGLSKFRLEVAVPVTDSCNEVTPLKIWPSMVWLAAMSAKNMPAPPRSTVLPFPAMS